MVLAGALKSGPTEAQPDSTSRAQAAQIAPSAVRGVRSLDMRVLSSFIFIQCAALLPPEGDFTPSANQRITMQPNSTAAIIRKASL